MTRVYQVHMQSGEKRQVDMSKHTNELLSHSIQELVNNWNQLSALQTKTNAENVATFGDPQKPFWLYYWE